ncbi:MAG: hypothetical protein LBM07_02875 [Culturomica sp.]|jgi:hypothetical protein|nr:hypothetical protein [Culturomica sp.]
MKNLKFLISAVLLAIITSFASCSQDGFWSEYETAEQSFSFAQASSNIALDATNGEVTLKVVRTTTNGVLELPIIANFGAFESTFTVPSSVSFEDGSASSEIIVEFSGINPGETYTGTLSLGEGATISVTGNATCKLTLKMNLVWEELGVGQWTDGLVLPLFGAAPIIYPVTVFKAQGVDGLYQVAPYLYNVFPYTAEDEVVGEGKIVIDARDPQAVFVEAAGTGIDWNYGEMFIGSVYGNLSSNITAYPLGTVSGKTIDLGAMFVADDDGSYVIGEPVTLVLP